MPSGGKVASVTIANDGEDTLYDGVGVDNSRRSKQDNERESQRVGVGLIGMRERVDAVGGSAAA